MVLYLFGVEEVGLNHVWTKVGMLPHIKHYIKPKSQFKALAAVLDVKVC